MMSEVQTIDAGIAVLDRASAERLDRRIRLMAGSIADSLSKLYDLVGQAKAGQIHVALGFPSWTAYVADACKVEIRVDRNQRRELVGWLAGEGMSQRAIAATVGISKNTVTNDLSQTGTPGPLADYVADPVDVADITVMADMADEQFEIALAEARAEGNLSRQNVADKCRNQSRPPTTGLDGKTYQRRKRPVIKPKPPISEEDAMRAVARIAELSAWGKACDGLLAALSYAASTRPPDDTDRYPAVEVFIERYQALGNHIDKWITPAATKPDPKSTVARQGDTDITLWSPDVKITVTADIDYDDLRPWVLSIYGHAAKLGAGEPGIYGSDPWATLCCRFDDPDDDSALDIFGATYLRLNPLLLIAHMATWIAQEFNVDSTAVIAKLLDAYRLWDYRLTNAATEAVTE